MTSSPMNIYSYYAFGLRIHSEMELPELPALPFGDGSADAEIKLAPHTAYTAELDNNPYEHMVKNGQVLFYVPDHAYFSIEAGRTIAITPLAGADIRLVRLYVLGSCMGALLLQRRLLPLHGSAVEIDGKAYAVVGDSGAGKSTLASVFIHNGYRLISDDIIAVSISQEEKVPIAIPSYPQQKLWQESLEHLGVAERPYEPIFGRETKYSVPVATSFREDPLPLAGIFILEKAEGMDGAAPVIRPLGKLERIQTLFTHTYRQFLVPRMDLQEWHFTTSVQLLRHCTMHSLKRAATGFSAHRLQQMIVDTISGGTIHE
ncbi:aldolase [Paenibacillus chartarius]|uniref:Aldolase n=1 Tax=Paenibacillus chartarius TaxID=747481 RepID=A0ABV6DUX2_9BACL